MANASAGGELAKELEQKEESNETASPLVGNEAPSQTNLRNDASFISKGNNVQLGSSNNMNVYHEEHYHFPSAASKSTLHETLPKEESKVTNSGSTKLWDIVLRVIYIGGILLLILLILLALVIGVWNHYSPVVSYSLPLTVPDFVGRENDVKQICQWLSFLGVTGSDDENPNMVNIIGAPGFGKSTLAIAVGNELLRRFITVHYVDLSNIKSSEDATATILATVTDRLEVINEKNYLRWARSIYHKTILILDNCDDLLGDKEVRSHFLKILSKMSLMSHSLRLLTTARYEYTLLDAKTAQFTVKPLSTNSSTQLLMNMSPLTNSSVASLLANLTGRAALAMKIVGALLKGGEREDLLLNELSSRPIDTLSPREFRPEDQIRVVINSSFCRLSSTYKRCLAILSQMPGSFDEHAAAAVLDEKATQVRKLWLKPMTRRCLLEFNNRTERYHMHKLINAFVKEDLRVHVDDLPLRDRRLHHYFRRLLNLAARYNENPRDVLRLYDYDQHNFHHVLFYFTDHNVAVVANDTIRQSVVTLAEQAANLFSTRLSASELFRFYRAAREYAIRLALDEKEIKYCNIMYLLVSAAMKEVNRKHSITRIIEEDRHFVWKCSEKLRLQMVERICLSPYELDSDIPDSVLDCYHMHTHILNLPKLDELTFWSLGHYFHSLHVHNAAIVCFVKAGVHFGDIDKLEKLMYIGSAFEVLKRNDQYGKRPLLSNLLEDINEKEAVSSHQSHTTLMFIGTMYLRLSNYSAAISPLLRAYDIMKDLLEESDKSIYRVSIFLGRAYSGIEDYKQAAAYFNRSLRISKKLFGVGHSRTANTHEELGDTLNKLGSDETIVHWIEAARVREELLEDGYRVFSLYLKIGKWLANNYHPFSWAEYYYKAYRILYKLDGAKKQAEIIPSSTSKELQTLQHALSGWRLDNFATNLYEYIVMPLAQLEDDPFVTFSYSLVPLILHMLLICFILAYALLSLYTLFYKLVLPVLCKLVSIFL